MLKLGIGDKPARLIVGLGNPGRRYAHTPHNLGFMVVDRLAERNGIGIKRRECSSLVGAGLICATPVLLAKPQTYMNLSGQAVQQLLQAYSLGPQDLILVYDDLDLPWKSLRIRPRGSPGGHHGVESVAAETGTTDFPRLRLGIAGYRVGNGAEFVLAPFRREQKAELDQLLEEAARAVEFIISAGVEKAMTMFNRRARGDKAEEE